MFALADAGEPFDLLGLSSIPGAKIVTGCRRVSAGIKSFFHWLGFSPVAVCDAVDVSRYR
jgi:hypothetical protein